MRVINSPHPVYIFIPFGLFPIFAYNPDRPIMILSAMKFPNGLRSFAGFVPVAVTTSFPVCVSSFGGVSPPFPDWLPHRRHCKMSRCRLAIPTSR